MKKYTTSPTSLEELRKHIPILSEGDVIRTGYIVDYTGKGKVEILRYKDFVQDDYEGCVLGVMEYTNFENFMNEIRKHVGRKKLYISVEYAAYLLAMLNGGNPEDYEE